MEFSTQTTSRTFSSVLGAIFMHIDNLECLWGRVIKIVKELETISLKESLSELRTLE